MSQIEETTSKPLEESEPESEPAPAKVGRFRKQYNKYRAKGKWFLIGFFVFYTIRDTLLYIVLPWYVAKGGMSVWEILFGE